jgi:hypothetical protein
MLRASRIFALLALLGMGSLTAGTAAALSLSCCSASCDGCPVSFCKGSDADKAPKAAIPAPAPSAPSIHAVRPVALFAPIVRWELDSLPDGFVRPLRR